MRHKIENIYREGYMFRPYSTILRCARFYVKVCIVTRILKVAVTIKKNNGLGISKDEREKVFLGHKKDLSEKCVSKACLIE